MQHRYIFVLGILSSLCISSTFAAQPIDLSQQTPSMLSSLQSHLEEVSLAIDRKQTTHIRLRQMYEGHPVWGGDVVVHVPKGFDASLLKLNNKSTLNGLIYQNLNSDLGKASIAEVNADKVLQKAISLYQDSKGNRSDISKQTKKLMVYVDQKNKAHWAYLISFYVKPNHGMPEKPTYIMDALTFSVYEQWDDIQTVDAEGGGFGGNPKMGKLIYDGLQNNFPKMKIERHQNICYLQNADVSVKDFRYNDAVVQFNCDNMNPEHNNVYWSGELNSVNGAYSPDNDALYIGSVIKDMYQNWYGIPVLTLNGDPMMLNMRVHEDMENAYWDGEQMTFGDGGSTLYPLVSLGVGAHEISHGFTQQHSNLMYFGQSGGLNESFSDMAAQAAEFYSLGVNTWQIGPEIFKEEGALRYMDDPTKDCQGRSPGNSCSIGHVSDYHVGLNVHYSSGIFNKVFYLMATAPGWNTKKAFDVMVQANRFYWTPLASFDRAGCGVLRAAKDYDYSVETVRDALSAVGINPRLC